MTDDNLLFIISQPRSGSTLLQKIISNTEYINTTSEPWLLLPYLSIFRTDIQKAAYGSGAAKDAIQEYFKKNNMTNLFVEEQRNFLLKLYQPMMSEKTKYILDKTPRYYEILDEIIAYFPNAKIIVLLRNPFNVLRSIIQTWHVKNLRRLEFYKKDIVDAPIILDRFCTEQAANPNVYKLYYEDVTGNSNDTIKAVFEWLALPYSKTVLNYKANQKAEGRMGDPVGVHAYQTITKQEKMTEKENNYTSVWSDFISGYLYYLSRLSLPHYTHYKMEKGKATGIFSFFRKKREAIWHRETIHYHDVILYLKSKYLVKKK